jgi:hypothetical protein
VPGSRDQIVGVVEAYPVYPEATMEPEVSTPRPGSPRASDLDRERAADVLRERVADGRISLETFVARLDRVFRARHRGQIDEALHDLPPRSRVAQLLVGAVGAWSDLTTRVRGAWQASRLPRLVLPDADVPLTIGRARDNDVVLTDLSVSRRHAQLRRTDGGWLVSDLGSTNGTHVAHGRITAPVTTRPGDLVWFGDAGFKLVEPPEGTPPAQPESSSD